MSKALFKKIYPMLGIALSLSLTACPAPNTLEPTETPSESSSPATPESTAPTAPPSSTPAATASQLQLQVKGDPALEGFLVQQVQGVCLNELSSLKLTLNLPSAPNATLMAALKAQGAEVNGSSVVLTTPVTNLAALIQGQNFTLANLPEGTLTGSVDLNNTAGKSMGSMGFSLSYKAGSNSVSVLLKPAGDEPNPKGCIPILPEITGANLTATAGGILATLPTTPNESAPPTVPSSSLPVGLAGIRMDVDNRFITAIGETRQLTVTLLDAAGNALPQDGVIIEWSTNRPGDLAVDTSGKIEALVGLGYAEVFAKVSGTNFVDSVVFDITDPSFFTTPTSSGGGGGRQEEEATSFDQEIPEFQINEYTGYNNTFNQVAMNASGDYVVVWAGGSEEGGGVVARVFDKDSEPLTDEFLVANTTVSMGNSPFPEVDMDDEGNFIVTWVEYSSYNVYAQRYDVNADPIDSAFLVDTGDGRWHSWPQVGMDQDGDFVFTWIENDGGGYQLKGRFYTDGEAGSEFTISQATTAQYYHDLAIDDKGDFIAAWNDYADGSGVAVQARRYTDDGEDASSVFQVSTETFNWQWSPSVALNNDGDFVVVWSGPTNGNSDDYDIYARRYNANNEPLDDEEFRVNTYTSDYQYGQDVAIDGDGNFIITWGERYGYDGSDYGIYAQRYDANGEPDGENYLINTSTSNRQANPRIAMNSEGFHIITWWSRHETAPNSQIYAGDGTGAVQLELEEEPTN